MVASQSNNSEGGIAASIRSQRVFKKIICECIVANDAIVFFEVFLEPSELVTFLGGSIVIQSSLTAHLLVYLGGHRVHLFDVVCGQGPSLVLLHGDPEKQESAVRYSFKIQAMHFLRVYAEGSIF